MATVLIVTTDPTFGHLLEQNLLGRHYDAGLWLQEASRGDRPTASLPVDRDGLVILDLPAQPTHSPVVSPFTWGGTRLAREAPHPLLVLADRSWSRGQIQQLTPSRVLTKPFSIGELVMAVRELVGPPFFSL